MEYPASAAPAPRPRPAPSASAAGSASASLSFGGLSSPIYPSYDDAPSMLSPGLSPHEFAQQSPTGHDAGQEEEDDQKGSSSGTPGPAPASPPPSRRSAAAAAGVHAAAVDSDDDDDDDDDSAGSMLASSMARSKALFSRPPPPRAAAAAAGYASNNPAVAAAAASVSYAPPSSVASSSAHRAPAAGSSASSSSSSYPLSSASVRPVSLFSSIHASPPRRGSVSSVSSTDEHEHEGMDSPPRVRHSQQQQPQYQSHQPHQQQQQQQSLRPHPPPGDSPARHTLFPTPHPPSSPQPARPAQPYASTGRPSQLQQQQQSHHAAEDDDLWRELPASSTPDALRTRISLLRERLQQTEGSRSAYAGHADALQSSLDDLARVNQDQYLQIKDLQQHIEFLTNLRTQPNSGAGGQQGSGHAAAPMDTDLSALRGRALENSHLQSVALQARVAQLEAALAQQVRTVALLEAEAVSRVSAGQAELDRLRTEMNRLTVLGESRAKQAARALSSTGQSVEQLQASNELIQEENRRLLGELAQRDEQIRQGELLLASTMEAFQTSERALALVHEQLQAQSEESERLAAALEQARMDNEALDASDADGEGPSVARMRAAHERELHRLREQYEDELNALKQQLSRCEQQLNYFKAKQQQQQQPSTDGAHDPSATQSIHNDSEADLLGGVGSGGSVGASPARGGRDALSPQPSPLASASRWQDYARPLAPEITALQTQLSQALEQVVAMDSEALQLREGLLRAQREKEEILASAAKQIEGVQRSARLEQQRAASAAAAAAGTVAFATPAASPASSPSRRFGSALAGTSSGVAIDREYVESLLEQIAQLKEANERLRQLQGSDAEPEQEEDEEEQEQQARRGPRSSAPARPISARKHGSVVPGDRSAAATAAAAAASASAAFDPDFLADLARFLPHLLLQCHALFSQAHQADRWARFWMRASSAIDEPAAALPALAAAADQSLASNDSSQLQADSSAAAASAGGASADPFPLDVEEQDLIAAGDDEQAFAELLSQRAEDDRQQMESVVGQLEARARANLHRGAAGIEELQEFVLKQLLRLSSRVSTLPPRLAAHRAHMVLEESEQRGRSAQLAERARRLESESAQLQDRTRRFELERSTVQAAMVDEEAEQRRQAEAILAGSGSGNAGGGGGSGHSHSGSTALTRSNFASALPLARRQSPFFLKEALQALEGSCSNPQHAQLLQQAIDLHEELRSQRKDHSDAAELRREIDEKQSVVDQLQEALESLKAQTAQQLASQSIVARHDSAHTIQNLTSQVALLTTRHEQSQTSCAALTTRAAELSRQHEDLQLAYDELDEDYAALEEDVRAMRGQIEHKLFLQDDLPSRRRRLKDGSLNPLHTANVRALHSGSGSASASAAAPSPGSGGGSHLTEHLAAISKSGKLLASISETNTALTSQAISQQDSIFKLESRLADQAAESRRAERAWNAEYLALVEKVRAQQEEHAAALAALRATHAEEVRGYTAQRHLLEMEQQRLQSSIAELNRQLASLDRSNAALHLDKQNLRSELAALQERMQRSLWSWRLQQEIHDYLRGKTDHRQKHEWDRAMSALREEIARLHAQAEAVAKDHERALSNARLLVSHPVASSLLVYLKSFPGSVAEKLQAPDHLGIKVLDLLREKLLAKIEHAAGVRARSDTISNEEKAASGFTESDASKTFINTRLLYSAPWSSLEQSLLESWESLLFNQFQSSEFSQEKIWLQLYKTCRRQIATIMRGSGAIAEEEESTQGSATAGASGGGGGGLLFGAKEQPPPVKLGLFAPKASAAAATAPSSSAAAASAIGAAAESRKKALLSDATAAAVDRDADGLAELMQLREASKATEAIRLDLERLAAENAELRASLDQHQQAQLDAAADGPRQAELTRDREDQISALEEHVRALERALAARQPVVQTSMRELELLRLTRSKLTMGSSADAGSASSTDAAARHAAEEASKAATAAQIAQLESSNASLVKENRSWARKFEEARGRANALQEELDALRASRPSAAASAATAAAEAAKTQGTLTAALEADNAQLQSDLQAKRTEAAKLQSAVHELDERVQAAQRKLADAEAYIAALTQAGGGGGAEGSGVSIKPAANAAQAAPAATTISVSPVPAAAAPVVAAAASGPSASFVAAAATAQRDQEKLRRLLADSESSLRSTQDRCATLESEVEVLRTTETALKQRVLDWKAAERAWKQDRQSLLASHELALVEAAAAATNDALDSSTASQAAAVAAESAHTASALARLQSQLVAAQSAQASLAAEVASLERDNAEWESKFTAVRKQAAEDKKKAAAALAAATVAPAAAPPATSASEPAVGASSSAPAAVAASSAASVRSRDALLASLQSELDQCRAELATEVDSALALRAKLARAQDHTAQQSQEVHRLQQRVAELEMLLGARGQQLPPQPQYESSVFGQQLSAPQSQSAYGGLAGLSQQQQQPQQHPVSSSSRPSFAASAAASSDAFPSHADHFAGASSMGAPHQPQARFAATFQGAPSSQQPMNTTTAGMRVTHHHHVLAPPSHGAAAAAGTGMGLGSSALTAGPLVPYSSSSAAAAAAIAPASPDTHRRHAERKRLADLYEDALRAGEVVDADAMAHEHVLSSPERLKASSSQRSRSHSPARPVAIASSSSAAVPGLAAIDSAFASAHAAIEADQRSHAAMERAWEAKRLAMQSKMHRKQAHVATAATAASASVRSKSGTRAGAGFEEKDGGGGDSDSDALFGAWPPKFQAFSASAAAIGGGAGKPSSSSSSHALVRAPASASVTSAAGESLPFPYFPRGPLLAPSLPVSHDASRFSLRYADEIGRGVRGAAAAEAESGSSGGPSKGRSGPDRERERHAIDNALGVRGITPAQVATLARDAALRDHHESIGLGVGPSASSEAQRQSARAREQRAAADDHRIGVRGDAPGALALARQQTTSARRAEEHRIVRALSPSRSPPRTKHKPYAAIPASIIRATASPANSSNSSSRQTPSKRSASAHTRRVR